MDTQPEKNFAEARIVVNYDDPPRKPAPTLSAGPVGWIRENLFGSPFDAVLTVVSLVIVVASVVGIIGWSIQSANWLAVNQNFRNFMAGTYTPDSIWRLNALVYLSAFMTGFTIATYARAGRDTLVIIGIGLAAMFALPLIAGTILPDPKTYLSAGIVEVQSGTVTETPNSQIAFAAQAGEQVRVTIPPDVTSDEQAIALAGFTDRPTRAYINAVQNRLDNLVRLDEIERELAAHARLDGTLLACSQFIDLKKEYVAVRDNLSQYAVDEEAANAEVDDELLLSCEEPLELPTTDYREVTEVYSVNDADVTVRVMNAAGDVLGESSLSEGSGELVVDLPEDGWYSIESAVAEEDVLVTLEVISAYPLIERSIVSNVLDESGEPLVDEGTGRLVSETIAEYVNIYDRFVTRAAPPTVMVDGEEEDVPLLRLTDAKYGGQRPLVDYVTLGLAPTFDLMNNMSLFFVIFAIAGYGTATGVRRVAPKVPGGGITGRMALGGWGLYTYLLFLLSIGVVSLSGVGMGNIIAMIVWVGIMFFIGMNYPTLNRSVGQGLLGLGLVMILGHVLYYRVSLNAVAIDPQPFLDFSEGLGGWALSSGFIIQLTLWVLIGMTAFNMGVGSEDNLGQGARRRGLIGSYVTWVGVLFLVPIIINVLNGGGVISTYRTGDLLPIAEMGLWGGFLLTFMLTAVGIVASFPIGVLLALGRRAHRYPAIKYICILYIEFVRGVPLVSVLFMASLLVPLVNPSLATVPGVIRAMVGITMFSAAYLAENVRGGLQSIPGGQEEAGKALGLNNVQVTTQIMLPQALRAVIPALVGQAISLFKDTSLVYIVGLADLTRVAIRVVAQAEFVGHRLETLMFISVIYFIFSYIMSYVSRRIEESGSGSARR